MVLLCALNSQFVHSNLAVHSLACASRNYAEQYGIKLEAIWIKEYSINDGYDRIRYSILECRPNVVAFSVYLWNVSIVAKLVGDVRKALPDCQIVLGGPEVSFGNATIGEDDYDYLIVGEGERAFFTFLAVRANPDFVIPDFFGYRCLGKRISANPVENLAELPFPYQEENVPLFTNRILYYEASRGCPFRCAYCLSSACGSVRLLPEERVFHDIDCFLSAGVPQVKFVDRTFNCQPERAYRIIQYILQQSKRKQTNFHFEVAGDLFRPALLELLREAETGRIQLEIGIQSTYQPALQASSRIANLEKCFQNIRTLLEPANIHIHVDLIAGLPYETLALFRRSFCQVYELGAHQVQLGFLKLLSGAPFHSMVEEHAYCFSAVPPYEILSNRYLSVNDLLELKRVEYVLDRYYNSGRFATALSYLLPFFEDAYELYRRLGLFYQERGYLFQPLSSRRTYDALAEFAAGLLPDGGKKLKCCLLFDYFSSDWSDLPPESLRELWTPERRCREKVQNWMKGKGLSPGKNQTVRLVGQDAYLFRYEEKNPVTGRFSSCFLPDFSL